MSAARPREISPPHRDLTQTSDDYVRDPRADDDLLSVTIKQGALARGVMASVWPVLGAFAHQGRRAGDIGHPPYGLDHQVRPFPCLLPLNQPVCKINIVLSITRRLGGVRPLELAPVKQLRTSIADLVPQDATFSASDLTPASFAAMGGPTRPLRRAGLGPSQGQRDLYPLWL